MQINIDLAKLDPYVFLSIDKIQDPITEPVDISLFNTSQNPIDLPAALDMLANLINTMTAQGKQQLSVSKSGLIKDPSYAFFMNNSRLV